MKNTFKIKILDCCSACEFCVDACPEVFAMCRDKVIILPEFISPEINDLVQEVMKECPVEAIVKG